MKIQSGVALGAVLATKNQRKQRKMLKTMNNSMYDLITNEIIINIHIPFLNYMLYC